LFFLLRFGCAFSHLDISERRTVVRWEKVVSSRTTSERASSGTGVFEDFLGWRLFSPESFDFVGAVQG
jgi:hypothetical protein